MAVLAGLGKRIRYCRKKMGYSQREIAVMLNVLPNKISKIESEEIGPNFEILIKLADIFGCSTDYLLGRKEAADKGPAIKQSELADLQEKWEKEKKETYKKVAYKNEVYKEEVYRKRILS